MQITERGKNRQMAINMIVSVANFIINFGIRFFLTPFLVDSMGAEAYGFIGLANNILGYSSLLTVALNSMAGRFISVKYTAGDIEGANKYYSSVFFSNLVLATIILLFSVGCVIWLEYMINIPQELIFDVKLLFTILAVTNIAALITNIWNIATFIKNRIDLSTIRGIISNFLNAGSLILLFFLFEPHIWYMGIGGLLTTTYYVYSNYKFTCILTPDLNVSKSNFEWDKVWDLLKSGVWNLVSKLGDILAYGLDLLVANLFLGPALMGTFALSKNVPGLIIGFFANIASTFAPVFTQLYAQGKTQELLSEINKSIRILGFFTAMPLVGLYVLGSDFYSLWLPSQDAKLLQLITIVGSMELVLSMPLESLWNIFTVTNRLKYSTLTILFNDVLVILSVLVAMFLTEDEMIRLMVLASTRSAIGVVRSLTFLPMYGAHCVGLNIFAFFRPLVKSVLCFAISYGICAVAHNFVTIDSWLELFVAGAFVAVICLFVSGTVILEKEDRSFIYNRFLRTKVESISKRLQVFKKR